MKNVAYLPSTNHSPKCPLHIHVTHYRHCHTAFWFGRMLSATRHNDTKIFSSAEKSRHKVSLFYAPCHMHRKTSISPCRLADPLIISLWKSHKSTGNRKTGKQERYSAGSDLPFLSISIVHTNYT